MKTKYCQRGLSSLGLLSVLLIISFVATCTIKMFPHYISSWSLNSAISRSVENNEYKNMSVGDIRRKLQKFFDVNRLDSIKAKDVKITKSKGMTTIDASYEQRMHLMFNVDVVIKFDNLVYEFSTE